MTRIPLRVNGTGNVWWREKPFAEFSTTAGAYRVLFHGEVDDGRYASATLSSPSSIPAAICSIPLLGVAHPMARSAL